MEANSANKPSSVHSGCLSNRLSADESGKVVHRLGEISVRLTPYGYAIQIVMSDVQIKHYNHSRENFFQLCILDLQPLP